MIAFRLSINGDNPKDYGFEDWSILTSHLFARRNPESRDIDDIEFSINGLAEEVEANTLEHVRFGKLALKVGDNLTIQIVETESVEKPIKRYRSDSLVQENPFTKEEIFEMERQEYERLKDKFGNKTDGTD